jgi:mRNA interferase MazF
MKGRKPCRGEIWMADFEPVAGHEQGGKRPCLVLSEDLFNHGPAGLAVVLPITSRLRGIPLHVLIEPPEGGLKAQSVVLPEMIRAISVTRLVRRIGAVNPPTLARAEAHVAALLGLSGMGWE